MSKSNTYENNLLALLFNATAIPLIADNTATTPLTNLYIALHTADPGEAGIQTTSECTYTGYARVASPRTSGEWTITTNSASPTTEIAFPIASGGSETATHFSVGSLTTAGAGVIYYSGTVTPNIVIASGVTPVLTTATAITED